ncbi:hypothetical protein BDZ45DRAFT_13704 [Acephala macrosclerotiorum]|nr:hypothetical protein BDZ45DRAFT_13704 [Acephala macrosclerotiorum]
MISNTTVFARSQASDKLAHPRTSCRLASQPLSVLAQSNRRIFSRFKQCSERASYDPTASSQFRSAQLKRIRNVLRQAEKLTELLTRHPPAAQLDRNQTASS